MIDTIKKAIEKGANIYSSVSGGKDGQAMTKALHNFGFEITGLIHADLGRVEWEQSLPMCEKLSAEFNVPLHVVRRSDGAGLLEHWKKRLAKLKGTGKPFWSSSKNRYCTSDLKRDPIDVFFRNSGHDFTISCEGIRAAESTSRANKNPLEIRQRITSKFYKGMTVEEAIANYTPGKRLALTWFPIFNFSLEDVWNTYGVKEIDLIQARESYLHTGAVPAWWPFHPAYVFGNERVSCKFCILGSLNDLQNAAEHDKPLLDELIGMQKESGSTFKHNWSLEKLRA